jgi:hypothetical protein
MPGTLQGRERLFNMQYQMVTFFILLRNGQRSWIISPSLVVICQYLSSTVRDLVPSIFSQKKGEGQIGSPHHERNNM